MTKRKAQIAKNWPELLDAAIMLRFGVETETFYDFYGEMTYVTAPKDGETPLTDEIHTFIKRWMESRPCT